MHINYNYSSLFFCLNMTVCSLSGNSIGDTGAHALAEGLKHCTKVKEVK